MIPLSHCPKREAAIHDVLRCFRYFFINSTALLKVRKRERKEKKISFNKFLLRINTPFTAP